MGFVGLILAAIIIWVLVVAAQKGTSNFSIGGEKKTPLDIARERYAKGEITAEEFERIKNNLM